MAIGRYSRHTISEKNLILAAVDRAMSLGMRSGQALGLLGLSCDRCARWRQRLQDGELEDRRPTGRPKGAPPTPVEVERVLACARAYPTLGARRLTWFMSNIEIVGLRTWQVLEILRSNHLLRRSVKPAEGALRRPARPTGPNQQWHIDLMYVWVGSRWYYLVDVIDAYSRYIIHWKLALTLEAGETTAIAQEALETIDRKLWPGLKVVRDNGSQFVSTEWVRFIAGVGVVDIAIRKRHPQSNGVLERLHKTHRAEGPFGEDPGSLRLALHQMERHVAFYRDYRPHTALRYLPPAVWHFGDPEAAIARRDRWLADQAATRQRYWATLAEMDYHSAPAQCIVSRPTGRIGQR